MKFGFIGLGSMGLPIATNLVKAGFGVTGFDCRAERVIQFTRIGGTPAASIAEIATTADVIGVCVDADDEVLSVVDDLEGALRPDTIVILHPDSCQPETCRTVDAICRERGAHVLEAFPSGFPDKAASADLTLMLGGEADLLARCDAYLRAISKYRFHVGPIGTGAAAKLANSVMYIIARLGVFEGLSVARANGIDPGAMVEIALASSGYSEALCRWRAEGAQHVVTPDAFDGRPRGGSRVLQTALMATRAGGFDLPLIDAVLELSEQNR